MSAADLAKLLFLSAIWGASFIFLRVAVPEFGAMLTATLRTLLAGLALTGYALAAGVAMRWRENLGLYAVIGLLAGVIPFSGFSYAALYLPAAYSAVLNSTAPLFAAVFSVAWLAEHLGARKLAGLLLGIAGVALLVGAGTVALNASSLTAFAACLAAASSFALASLIIKKTSRPGSVHPIALAAGPLMLGGIMMLPTIPFSLPAHMPSMLAMVCLAAMSLVSSGLAQVLFMPLIVKIGPTRAMSVTFLIPLFSMFWGSLFLGETVGASTMFGAAVVLVAMALVLWPTVPRLHSPDA